MQLVGIEPAQKSKSYINAKYSGTMHAKEKIIQLIKKGESINSIRKITGFAKSTIYYHYKKIKGRKIKLVSFSFRNEEELGEFLGVFAGDGSFSLKKTYHYLIRFFTGYYEKEYADYLREKFTKWFNKPPMVSIAKHKNVLSCIITAYHSKQIYNLLREYLWWEGKKTYSIKLKNLNLKKREFNIGFLRGLIDTDGSFYKPKRRISFSTVSKELANQFMVIVSSCFHIKPLITITNKNNWATLYTISFHGQNAKRLSNIIKSSNQNKIYTAVV